MHTDRSNAKKQLRQERWQERQERSRATRSELDDLRARVQSLRASLDAKHLETEAVEVDAPTRFSDLPLSQRTQLGLERGNYRRLTPVQCDALPLALAGLDVLGAARTGSGKTLCFVLPLLERLYVERWEAEMGVGALVLSPTRELALQIFKVLQLVGYRHVFSAALLTGGRDVAEERRRLHAISIVVGTPGRVLHHLDEAAGVSLDNLQLLALDEADRLLDMGFREALLGILRHVPQERQTLLFSATQTTDVQMLAELALREPRYVTAHAITAAPTPATLSQNFVVLELHRKLDALLLFLKRHPNDKVVVFVSTCNQVRYMYLAFSKILKKMRIPSMCLTSKMKQFRREEVFLTFCRCRAAVLFCTDVAARGLDFPLVHWVVQFDCPDSAQTYIHRAGRTARAGARGVSLLFLTPREVPMLSFLAHKRVPMREIQFRPGVLQESREIFVALVVQGLKYEAQKAFIAYLRSIYFASNKAVFEVAAIDVARFAHSLGLLKVPDMSELQNIQRGAKNLPWDVVNYMAERQQQQQQGAQGEQQQKLTRREKHLAASDMFRMLQQKQRYVTHDDDDDDKGEETHGYKGNKKSDDSTGRKNRHGAQGEQDEEEEEEEEEDTFLVKKPRDAMGDPREEMRITVEERMAGLSKRKKRKYIETADLRVRDLGLSKRTVFSDDDDDDDEDEDEKQKKNKRKPKAEEREEDEDEEFVTQRIGATSGAAAESDSDSVDYAARLRRRIMEEQEDDAARAKRLRRLRRMQREGKVAKRAGLDEGGKKKRGKDEDEDEDDDEAYESTYGDSSDVSSQGSLGRLISAAKGNLYSDDEGAEEEEEAESEEDVRAKQKGRQVTSKRKRPRGA